VLDLIRDFDLEKGCNIRFVSWFGHGLYCCVFLGKQMRQPDRLFVENGFLLGRNDLPWDLAEQVDWMQAATTTPDYPKNLGEARLWIKEIALVGDHENCLQILRDELKKILLANPAE
jgi:sugar/nucleoside kinase (ribokinase family)